MIMCAEIGVLGLKVVVSKGLGVVCVLKVLVVDVCCIAGWLGAGCSVGVLSWAGFVGGEVSVSGGSLVVVSVGWTGGVVGSVLVRGFGDGWS